MYPAYVHHHLLKLFVAVLLIASAVPLALAPASAAAVTGSVWVDATNGSDSNPGTEAEPFKTLTHALAASVASDTLVIEPGTYDVANGETFPINDNGTSLVSAAGAAVTIIAGDGTTGLITGQAFGPGDVISGLTFTGGGVDAGAALSLVFDYPTGTGAPIIENNVFEYNHSEYIGGALALFGADPGPNTPVVQNNVFRGNTAQQGGAVAVSGNVAATFLGNQFDDNSAYMAGALIVLTDNATTTVDTNTFTGNQASALGGAIVVSAQGSQQNAVVGNTFTDNHAAYDGGAIYLGAGNVTISGSHASGNSAVSLGGFARIGMGTVDAYNNAITGSSAGDGGAAWYVTSGTLSERNDTVTGSVASPSATTADPEATLDIANSIYWNPALTMDIQRADAVAYSCVYDALVADASRGNVVGTGVIALDPMFTPGDVTLELGSPCIDTADAALAPGVDAFGHLRPQDGDSDGIALPDMGCFEWGPLMASEAVVAEAAAAVAEELPIVVEPTSVTKSAAPSTRTSTKPSLKRR